MVTPAEGAGGGGPAGRGAVNTIHGKQSEGPPPGRRSLASLGGWALRRNHRLRPILVLVVEPMLPVIVWHLAPLDEDAVDLRSEVERIPARDEQVRELALRDRS